MKQTRELSKSIKSARINNGRTRQLRKLDYSKIEQAHSILAKKKSLVAKMLETARNNW